MLVDGLYWKSRAKFAKKQPRLSGYYNENYVLKCLGKNYLFRFPQNNAAQMDPRPMVEKDVLEIISKKFDAIPNLIYASNDNQLYIQNFIEGDVVINTHPPGKEMPQAVLNALPEFYKKLALFDAGDMQHVLKPSWPKSGSMKDFFVKLFEKTFDIYKLHYKTHGKHYDFLNITKKSFAYFLERAETLAQRPWRLIHADLHRGNMILDRTGKTWFIDWELALYGDILYCIASHIHRSRYFEPEAEKVIKSIKNALPEDFQNQFDEDLAFYLNFEAFKSILVDTVRFPEIINQGSKSTKEEAELCMYYTDNLNKLSTLIGCKSASPHDALKWFNDWGS